jgi:hypothetical protein
MQCKQLRDYVFEMCGCGMHGGRAVCIGLDKCILYDIPQWTDSMSRCVKNRFPSVDITVSYASSSLTGFQVLFVLASVEGSYLMSFAVFAIVVLACIPLLIGLFGWVAATVAP